MFELRGVTKSFGALIAVDDLSFIVKQGEMFGVAGPNGAGKSTLLNLCTGALPLTSGEILLDGQRIDGRKPYALSHLGLARTFQIPTVFTSLSVRENVEVGTLFGAGGKNVKLAPGDVDHILAAAGLVAHADINAATADLLTRKKVMLAAALATRPRMLFMDEPLAGLNQDEIETFANLIGELKDRFGLTMMMVEHKIRALSGLSDRILILHHGARLCLDTPEKTLRDPQVIDVYLGAEYFA